MRGYQCSPGSAGDETGATTVSKRSSTSAPAAAATYLDVQDPVGRRRVLNARYKLLRQLEAQVPRSATTTHSLTQVEEEEYYGKGEPEEADSGGESWLSKFLAGSLTLVVGGFICYVIALHHQRLRVLFE